MPPRLGVSLLALLAATGCVAQRGVDFGHWAGIGESTPTVRIVRNTALHPPTAADRILLLPPVGVLPADVSATLYREIYRQARNYFPVSVACLPADAPPACYAGEDNLLPDKTQLNMQEAARLGAALGASHVLCIHVRDFRPYLPQVLAMRLVLIDVATAHAAVDVDASFDATRQQVVLELADYLQRSRAREYGTHSLGIMLQSPSEYAAFVSASSCRRLAHALWGAQGPKETVASDEMTSMQRGSPCE